MSKHKLSACHAASTPDTDGTCTPKQFFLYVQKKLRKRFTIDIAATKANRLCKKFIGPKQNTLESEWKGLAWCNPPYSLAKEFVKQCALNAENGYGSTVMLMAARTDRDWWHNYARAASHIIYIKGRLKFAGAKAGAPFPSVLLVFSHKPHGSTKNVYWQPNPYERGFDRGKPK